VLSGSSFDVPGKADASIFRVSTLKVEGPRTLESSLNILQTTRRHISEDSNPETLVTLLRKANEWREIWNTVRDALKQSV
jgi:hypothetical protein